MQPARRLIVTADDFGLAIPVNEAVERAHLDGILSTASLMVAAPATADAVRRARSLPRLRVGLHVVLVNGAPALAPERIPDLVHSSGRFSSDLFGTGVRYFFRPGIRQQLEAEIRAQFAAFAATGLELDHVNAQNHFHVHPTVLSLILKVGRDFGLRAVRIPYEPDRASIFLAPWLALMKAQLRKVRIAHNDFIFGMNDTGHMTADVVKRLLPHLPRGVSELYFHPATRIWPEADPPDYDYTGEFAALIDPAVTAELRASDIQPTTFGELAARGI